MTYASEVLADSPLAFWKFDEPVGSPAFFADSSGNGRDLVRNSAAALQQPSLLTSESMGYSVQNPVGSRTSESWMNVSAITVEAWVKFTGSHDTTNGEAIVARYEAGGFNWLLWRNTANRLACQVNVAGTLRNVVSPSTVATNTTYHVAFTFDGSTIRLVVNGAEVATGAFSGALGSASSLLSVGRYSSSAATDMVGYLDASAVYGSALSVSRLGAHYTAGTGADPTTYANLAGQVPAPTADLSGTVTLPATSGTLAGLVPAPTAQLEGEVPGAPISATLAGVVPAPTAQLSDGAVFEPYVPPRLGYGIRFGCSNRNNVRVSAVPADELVRLVPLGREAVEV